MAHLIQGNNCLDSWITASQLIINEGEQTNLIVEIDQPDNLIDLDKWLVERNPKRVNIHCDNIRQIINTIFPYNLEKYFPGNRTAFYKKYQEIYGASKNKKWGTYFQRLISFGKGFNPAHCNQLENAITALKGNANQRYYINFHLTAASVESNIRPMGGPCWQFGQLMINSANNTVDFVVMYRNHDFFNKALGNYIGLSKLLQFICRESNRQSGKLIVHSIHAYSAAGEANLATLVA